MAVTDEQTKEVARTRQRLSLLHVTRATGQGLVKLLEKAPHGFRVVARWQHRMPCIHELKPLGAPLGISDVIYDIDDFAMLIGPGDAAHFQHELRRFGNRIAMLYRRPVAFERVESASGVRIAPRWHHLAVCGATELVHTVDYDVTCPACIRAALTPPPGHRQPEYHPYGRFFVRDEELLNLRDSVPNEL
jgi:hypothetical protein